MIDITKKHVTKGHSRRARYGWSAAQN